MSKKHKLKSIIYNIKELFKFIISTLSIPVGLFIMLFFIMSIINFRCFMESKNILNLELFMSNIFICLSFLILQLLEFRDKEKDKYIELQKHRINCLQENNNKEIYNEKKEFIKKIFNFNVEPSSYILRKELKEGRHDFLMNNTTKSEFEIILKVFDCFNDIAQEQGLSLYECLPKNIQKDWQQRGENNGYKPTSC